MTKFNLQPFVENIFTQSSISISFVDMAENGHSKGWRRAGRHFLLLLWKNFILAKRMPVRTFLEITLPVFFGFLLLGIRHIVKSEFHSNNTIYPAFPINQVPDFNQSVSPTNIAYAPQTPFINQIMLSVKNSLDMQSKSTKNN